MRLHLFLFISIALSACELIADPEASVRDFVPVEPSFSVELIVLGTLQDAEEINHRAISEIPHPFVVESMELFKKLSAQEKAKIHFIHFNHTNPLLDPHSAQSKEVIKQGFRIARMGQVFEL